MHITSIQDLRNIVTAEQKSTGRSKVGTKALAVLADMLEHPGAAAVESISELAARNAVDPSTLTRLGKRLGFTGFNGLQDVFRHHVAETEPFYSARIKESLSAQPSQGTQALIWHHLQSEADKILAMARDLDVHAAERAVEQLVAAKRVYVLALRATYGLGFYFSSYLSTLRTDVNMLGGPGNALATELDRITTEDVLVAISFRPFTKSTVAVVDVLRDAKVPLLTITDTKSPIALDASHGTTITIDHPFHFDSSATHFAVLQTLLLLAARRLGTSAVERSSRLEKLYRTLDIEVS
ncbi:MurR/RpiR family transcriptional regulator [Castellaniella sp.]|uniref:MurR/RpiR family transcriptional regulator n=1 Tax=Castellaniella sp. TaxID=1955812 RepID=UPI0035693A65